MTNNTATKLIEFVPDLSETNSLPILVYALCILFLLGLIIVLLAERKYSLVKNSYVKTIGVVSILIFTIVFLFLLVINLYLPIELTKTTQTTKENIKIVQESGKLLTPEGLTVYLTDGHGDYSKQTITIDDDIKIITKKGSGYTYTVVRTKVTYSSRYKLRAMLLGFSGFFPKNESKFENILTVPQESLFQNK